LDYNKFKCKWIDPKPLCKMADETRDKYWPDPKLPVNSEEIVEFKLKLDIDPIKDLFSTCDIDAYLKRDLTGIVVDYDRYMMDKFTNRMRFSFAHELGHYFLHKELYKNLGVDSPLDWKEFILNVPENEYRNFEWQANEFAGRLIVPYPELAAEMKKAKKILENNKLIPFLKKDPDAVLSRISPTLCKPFGVSTEVIETRVKREGLWPPKI
jgi:hypothetical protein